MTAGYRRQLRRLPLYVFWPALLAAAPVGAGTAKVQEVAAGVYVRAGHTAVLFEADNIANTGIVIGSRCVAVIDTGGSVVEGRAIDNAISELTDLPVCFVINTHVHPDHTLGNSAFRRDDVQFIGHEKLPRAMALRGDTYLGRAAEHSGLAEDPSQIVLPEHTVSREVQLDLGHRMLTLRAHGTAHTDNDLSVLDVQTGTVFVGDLVFLEHVPVLDGSINGWLDELDAMMKRSFARVVPGHGPAHAEWPEAGAATRHYLHDLRAATRAWIADGGELGAAQQAIEAARPERWQLIEQYHKRNVAAAFAELEWED